MEPADQTQLHHKLGQQDALLESQQQQLLAVMQCVQTISHQVSTLTTALQAAPSISAARSAPVPECAGPGGSPDRASYAGYREPRLPAPERYDGSPGGCRSFLTQCQLIFSLQPQTFPTDVARVAYLITQLTGRARNWATAMWSADQPCLRTAGEFMAEMQRVFDRSATGLEAGRELLRLRQGRNTVSDFAIDFQTLAADSGWEGRSLVDTFSARAGRAREARASYPRAPRRPGEDHRARHSSGRPSGGSETGDASPVPAPATPRSTTSSISTATSDPEGDPPRPTINPQRRV